MLIRRALTLSPAVTDDPREARNAPRGRIGQPTLASPIFEVYVRIALAYIHILSGQVERGQAFSLMESRSMAGILHGIGFRPEF